ncbi:nitric oxide reductase transcriptional regulator NorR [Vibrio sonorensis]|uniref:nitric oxide reductase transcriptional regulator NorR n=1 Tax=Vibrio sonorensis TaxID=1004316 RepID=UPI0008DAC63C|nr:nitric oxide reductase transcriptional regulator NorR [Vibrio sonorensis]
MNDIQISTLIELTIGLASGHSEEDKFTKLLDATRKAIQCDCVGLLSLQGDTLVPLALQGVTQDTLGRRFKLSEHPRLARICESKQAVRFDADCDLPDPFDCLLIDHEGDLPIHACMGLPLRYGDALLGVLTMDSLTPNVFDNIPQRSLEALSAIMASSLKVALTVSQLEQQAKQVQQRLEELSEDNWEREGVEIVGSSPVMLALREDINVVAPSNFNILIHGETGVGKELVARSLHMLSPRRKQPLVYVNCAAIPESLLESELFGHVKGAFTGADKDRMGKFALADGGTLFLDEIGELPMSAQSKILRALQSNEIQPVGQDAVHTIDVRVLAATNRDLKQEVNQGRFRSDLFHRLTVYPIEVPPLRDRTGDIELLSGFFLEIARRKLGITRIKFTHQSLLELSNYSWPGNVRELEHVINRAALKARARCDNQNLVSVSPSDIGVLESGLSSSVPSVTDAPTDAKNQNLREATENFQRQLIVQTLSDTQYNWAKAARCLETDRANLVRLAKRLGIQVTKQHKIEM